MDYDEKGSKKSKAQPICRDYLKNNCTRGLDCRYLHPDEEDEYNPRPKLLSFCHDYQNGICMRYPCKFLHCSSQEEKYYFKTGELPERILHEAPWTKWIAVEVMCSKIGENTPICKDFLNGECTRKQCKFRHVSDREVKNFFNNQNRQQPPPPLPPPPSLFEEDLMFGRRDDRMRPPIEDLNPPSYKRRRFDEAPLYTNGHIPASNRAMFVLEEENAILRQRVSELKKRVDDLQATNEFLLEQNAQMRINDKGAASLTAVTVPAVTITNTGQMQAAQAPNHQVMNAAIRTVTASVATVPVSIAAVAGTPCSIATVSMAPVQIPPAVVTMAQPSGQNPSGGPQALPISMSEAAGNLVSYPIMTRPVLQPNITH